MTSNDDSNVCEPLSPHVRGLLDFASSRIASLDEQLQNVQADYGELEEQSRRVEAALATAQDKIATMKHRNEPLVAVLLSEFGYPDDAGTDICTFAAKVLHEQRIALAAAKEENERLRDRLQFDPGGSDKIDELEQALDFCRHDLAAAREENEGMRLEYRHFVNWVAGATDSRFDHILSIVNDKARAVLAAADGKEVKT